MVLDYLGSSLVMKKTWLEGKNLIKGGQLVPDGGKSVKPVDIKYHVLVGKKNGIMMNEKQRQWKTENEQPKRK